MTRLWVRLRSWHLVMATDPRRTRCGRRVDVEAGGTFSPGTFPSDEKSCESCLRFVVAEERT